MTTQKMIYINPFLQTGIHRHGNELRTEVRGSKANALQAVKPLVVINNTPSSRARTQLSVTVSNPQSPSVVGQLAQSHRVLQPVAQMVGFLNFN